MFSPEWTYRAKRDIIFSVNLAFLLHIYQPPVQENRTVEDITKSSYLPLLKTIKNSRDLRITLNIPLSLSYLLHATGSDETNELIRELFEAEKMELTSCGAYHPLLTRLPDSLVEREIVLNERGLGYYYGKDRGFEGQEALMIKNVTGFFPPEAAINQNLVKKLDSMGYSWVFADDVVIPRDDKYQGYDPVHDIEGLDIKLVTRHHGISNMLSFKRYLGVEDLLEQILYLRQEGKDLVLALDGEFFGHHYKEGIFLLETLVAEFNSLGIKLVTVKELVDAADGVPLKEVRESSWGASLEQIEEGNIYPLWDAWGNELHKLLWEVQRRVIEDSENDKGIDIKDDQGMFETFPLWDLERLGKMGDVGIKNEIYQNILLLQSLHSDQFWWASDEDVGGRKLHKPSFVKKALSLYEKYATVAQKKDLLAFLSKKRQEIEAIL